MACPYFQPTQRCATPLWPHPPRLPLGDAWTGRCTAPGHEGAHPTDAELKDGCNLGYARCPRLPRQRSCDAVRFILVRDRDRKLAIQYVCEIAHAPGPHGMLEFDTGLGRWTVSHPDPRLQKLAECYLDSYLRRVAPASCRLDDGHVARQEEREGKIN